MKQKPTDKDLRLYASLSHVDGDLILDGVIPALASGKTDRATHKGGFFRPWAASLALCAVVLALAVSLMMDMGLFRDPATDPSQTDTTQEANRPGESNDPATPTVPGMDTAATLHRGMSLSELFALMGEDYTEENGSYTFTLDTGEGLTVSTAPNEAGETTVTGFAWLGDTAQAVNPLELPEDILHIMQDYATDKIIPVYTMISLIGKYNKTLTRPSVEGVLEDAELGYFRVSTDGNTVMLDADGVMTEVYASEVAFTDDVSALFDESVRIKTYHPIVTSNVSEGEAVYLQTSIGDYILYLHSELSIVPEDADSPAPVPYLLPVGVFHQFAYRMADKSAALGIGWDFTDERMAVIEPYRMTGEGYEKPVNLATPEAAESVTVGSYYSDWANAMGTCLGCKQRGILSYNEDSGEYPYVNTLSDHLHYWVLTDGRGLVVSTKMTENDSARGPVYQVSVVLYTDSADALYEIGTPSTETVSLLRKDMSSYAVNEILGTSYSYYGGEPSVLRWNEDGLAHSCTLTWKTYTTGGTEPRPAALLDTFTHNTQTVESVLPDIQVGISFADIVARLGACRDGHEVDYWGGTSPNGYHFWELPDGRWLAAYVGYDIPILSDPFGMTIENHFNMSVMQILWLDSEAEIEAIGTPSLSRAQCIEAGMKPEVVRALMGEPTATISTLASMWEWSEDGKTYTCTVYLQNNRPEGLFKNFDSVYRCEITEGPLTSLPIPDKDPTPEDAARVTEGMTASDLIKLMGSRVQRTTLVDAELYCWTLTDGRAFCVLTEGDLTCPMGNERVVTYTFYRGSMADVSVSTAESMEAVTEGMSLATVFALLGTEPWDEDYDYPSSLTVMWGTPDGAWWEITVTFEAVEYPETNRSRAYAVSVYIDKGI